MMFTTSLTAAAVASLLATGTLSPSSDWAPSYATARTLAHVHGKPIAVFLTPGNLAKLTNGESLPSETSKLISEKYIAVQIDTTTEDGQAVAAAFGGVTQGVVLSDGTGDKIALKYTGTVPAVELSGFLIKYSSGSAAITTEYRSPVSMVAAPASVYQPQPIQYGVPSYGYPTFAPVSGGCASGNCRR